MAGAYRGGPKDIEPEANPAAVDSLVGARFEAQKLVFGPILFQAVRLLRDLGVLTALRSVRSGLTFEQIAPDVSTSHYGLRVLLEAGLAAGVVRAEGERYILTRTGACILSDELTRINLNLVHDCCFRAIYYLEDSIRQGRPVGLQEVFGNRGTIYSALPEFAEPARTSWYQWDHYYSDAAFPEALRIVFRRDNKRLLDVGGNTGKWAVQCVRHAPGVSVTILDLPEVAAVAQREIEKLGLQERIATQACDLMDRTQLFPAGYDAIWMSQLLVCFSEDDVQGLLQRAAAAMAPDATLYILDTFWDRQEFEVSAYCLQAISLYFTCLANGCSRMYRASEIQTMAEAAGLVVESITDNIGICSSLFTCRRR